MSAKEEQLNELEALQAIYMEQYAGLLCAPICSLLCSTLLTAATIAADDSAPETKLSIALKPSSDDSEKCWVSVRLCVEFVDSYPLESTPTIRFADVVGLTDGQVNELTKVAEQTAQENIGAPAVYAVAERVREWLIEHNEQPSDGSAFDEMMRRQRAKASGGGGAANGAGPEEAGGKQAGAFDRENDPSIKKRNIVSAEEIDEAVRRKKYGTPVTAEAFFAWRAAFEAEMAARPVDPSQAWMTAQVPKGRLTGRQMFERDSSLATSDVALAAAAERAAAAAKAGAGSGGGGAAAGAAGDAEGAVDESLFLAGADDDLDDLDDDEDYEPGDEDDEDEEWDEEDEEDGE